MSSDQYTHTARDNIRKILASRGRSSFEVSVALGKNRTYLDDFIRGRKQSLGLDFSRALSTILDVERAYIEGVVIIDTDDDLSKIPLPIIPNVAALDRIKEVLRQIEQFADLKKRSRDGSPNHKLYAQKTDDLETELAVLQRVIKAGNLIAEERILTDFRDEPQCALPKEFIVDQLGANPKAIYMVRVEDSSMQRSVGTSFAPGDYVIINREKQHVFTGGLYALSRGDYQFIRLISPSGTDAASLIARAYNPDFPEIELASSPTVRISGKVVAHLRRL